MKDLEIEFEDRPGALADIGEALARAGIGIEGGASWRSGARHTAHFLFHDGDAAERVLAEAGVRVVAKRDVVAQQLRHHTPGQLGELGRRMADAGVNIEVFYTDHEHRMILVVDDAATARTAAGAWAREKGL